MIGVSPSLSSSYLFSLLSSLVCWFCLDTMNAMIWNLLLTSSVLGSKSTVREKRSDEGEAKGSD